jgi:hypothetical protein
MSRTNLLTNPTGIQTDIPEVDKLLLEASVHMQAGEEYFRTGIIREGDGKSYLAPMMQAVIQLQAAILCQQQAMIHLLTDEGSRSDSDEVSTCN